MGDIGRPLRHVAGDQFANLVEAYLRLVLPDIASSMRTSHPAASPAVEQYNFANANCLRKFPEKSRYWDGFAGMPLRPRNLRTQSAIQGKFMPFFRTFRYAGGFAQGMAESRNSSELTCKWLSRANA